MSDYETACIICLTPQKVETYGNWTCARCGQFYEYDEGHRIVLSNEQIVALRSRELVARGTDDPAWHPIVAAIHAGSFGGDRHRDFTGQEHTWAGALGRRVVPSIRYRDLGDTIVEALSDWSDVVSRGGLPSLDKVDLDSLAQAILHRLANPKDVS